jgi:predicted FMN-binding regulatory protein PaiB
MSAVSETIVREYFELHGFLVRQQRKYLAPTRAEDEEIDFLVINPAAGPAAQERPFVLHSSDLAHVARAVVVIKGWHTDTFSPGVLACAPEIFRFLEPAVFQPSARALGAGAVPLKLLVVPALPQTPELREQSIQFLRDKGVDGVLPFRTMLADLIAHVQVNHNYQKSDLLQIIRILKNYDFCKDPQMELFKPKRRRRAGKAEVFCHSSLCG